MAYLLDTHVLVRLANVADTRYAAAAQAVVELHRRSKVLHVTPQVLVEFRNVATRARAQNGLGLPAADVEAVSTGFESTFPLLPETPDVFPAWKSLVGGVGIIGKQVHDARLVAICHVHAVSHLLTFNVADFARMAAFGPGISVVDPETV